ncbi:MAG: hypothetical protein AB1422_09085 [bacterium]
MRKTIFILWLMMVTSIASAELSITAKVGFEGKYRDLWQFIPILIEVDNSSSKTIKGELVLSFEIERLSGEIERINTPYTLQIHIPAKTKSNYWFYLPFMNCYQKPEINLLVNNKIVASTCLSATPLWDQEVVLGIVQQGVISNCGIQKIGNREYIFLYPLPSTLPDEWIGYSNIETILVDSPSLNLLTSKQRKALKMWSALGGKLVNIEGMSKDKIDEWLKEELNELNLFLSGIIDIVRIQTFLSKIPQMEVPSPGIIFLLLFIYLLLIGPINYIILKKKKKSEISWITIPILVILFSLTFYIYAQKIKGKSAMLNELSILHIPAGKNWGILNASYGLFSPEKISYNLRFNTRSFIRFPQYNFYEGVGYKIIQTNNETYLQNLLVEKWAMKTFITQSIIHLDGTIICQKDNQQVYVVNTSHYQLLDSAILINGVYLSLGNINCQTKQTWEIDKLKEETQYRVPEFITPLRYMKKNFFLAWLEKPIIEPELSIRGCERKSTILVVIPITAKEQ